jgi:putative nucleotidyltransferase with HDIG domain
MIRFLKKQRLAARGMSCGKTRLATSEHHVFDALENGLLMRAVTIVAAAVVLLLFSLSGNHAEPLKHFLYASIILALAVIQPFVQRDSLLQGNSRLALFLGMILLQIGIGKFLQAQVLASHLDISLLPLLIPYALAPLTLSVLLGSTVGFSACLVGALWWAVLQDKVDQVPLLMVLTSGVVSVLATLRVRRRSRLLRAGLYSGVAVCILGLLTEMIGPIVWEAPQINDWQLLGLECLAAVGTGVITAVVVSGSLPLLEKAFRITTEISLLEMADLNHPLLRRLSMEAPGTYHHSLAMANLAETCAEKVGANSTLCRVAAYYHDIGKLVKPEYFVENIPAGTNPHDDLTPTMSALIILSHVKDGIDLAIRNKLNSRIVDGIQQHHGTTLVEYFYQRACRQERDARAGGDLMKIRQEDIPKVSEENFRYSGPKPQSIEAVILGLADAAESAARSLERPTLQRLDDLVHDLLQDRINDDQYDEAPVTMCQLQEIASTLVSCLASMHHTRIGYRRRDESATPSVAVAKG